MNDSLKQLACGGAPQDARPRAALRSHDTEDARDTHAFGVARPFYVAREAPRAAALRRALFVLPLTSVVFAVSALWSPSDLPGVVLCPFRALTGLPCPGCGMTRAFCSMGHGEIARAFGYNALAPFVFAGALLVWAHALATVLKLDSARSALERLKPTPLAARFMLAVTVAWWAVRLAGGL